MTIVKHFFVLLLGAISAIVLTIVLYSVGQALFNTRNYEQKVFDSAKWKSKDDIDERLQMMRDLQYYYLVKGMKQDDVLIYLGVPDEAEGDSVIRYEIGSTGFLALNQSLVFTMEKEVVKDFLIE